MFVIVGVDNSVDNNSIRHDWIVEGKVFKTEEEAETRLLECKRTYPTYQFFLLMVVAEVVPVDPKYEVKYKN